MGPLTAMDLLLSLPMEGASNEPCHVANPELWEAWCSVMDRPHENPTDVWSEYDVAISVETMLRQYIRDRVIGKRSE